MENIDRAPYLMDGGRWGYRMGSAEIHDSMLRDGLNDAFSGEHSGWHTEDLAADLQIGRDAQDAWAARSQARFAAAQAEGRFEAEIVVVEGKDKGKKGVERFVRDEQPRPDTTVARLKPAFQTDGTITAGNAPGLNSGGAAMVVAERGFADRHGLAAFGRLVHQVLERAGWRLGDVERFEINEAFAVVPLAVAQDLGLPLDIVNVDGGAIAHGHPIGATGAVLTTRLLHAMRRDGVRRGIVTLCIGGGQGIALALEAA